MVVAPASFARCAIYVGRWIFNVSEMLSRDRKRSLLEEPGDRGVNSRIYIVGGAAIASHTR